MAKFRVYGRVEGSIYLGEFEADTREAALEMATEEAEVNFCHSCAGKCEDPFVTAVDAELEE